MIGHRPSSTYPLGDYISHCFRRLQYSSQKHSEAIRASSAVALGMALLPPARLLGPRSWGPKIPDQYPYGARAALNYLFA